jgi:Zn-dependent protease/CBS domain-containing protein
VTEDVESNPDGERHEDCLMKDRIRLVIDYFQLSRQFQLGRPLGIPLRIDCSWPPVVILHIWLLSSFWLPSRITPAWPLWQNLLLGGAITALFFVSIVLHELAHCLQARLEGIEIHDIQLHIFGGWARLVGEPRTAMAEFRVAVAGPASSFLLGVAAIGGTLALQQLESRHPMTIAAIETTYYLAIANLFLAMFNLLPGLPLDGGRAVRALLWHRSGDLLTATRTTWRMGVAIAYLLIAYSLFLLFQALARGLFWQDFLFSTWLLVIALFLRQAAEKDLRARERQQASERPALKSIDLPAPLRRWAAGGSNLPLRFSLESVGSVMRSPVVAVPPTLTVDDFIDEILSHERRIVFPVAVDGQLHGILALAHVRQFPRDDWAHLSIEEVMIPIAAHHFVDVEAPLSLARERMTHNRLSFLAVVDADGLLVGALDSDLLTGRIGQ